MKDKIKIYLSAIGLLYICFWIISFSVFTDNIGLFIFKARDNIFYVESVYRILENIENLDFNQAFSGSTYGYGYGYFIILSIFAFPGFLFQNDTAIAVSMLLSNLVAYLFSLIILFYYARIIIGKNTHILFYFIIPLLFLSIPSANYLLVNLHPELWQLLFYSISLVFFKNYYNNYKIQYLILSSVFLGIAIGIKISLAIISIIYLITIVLGRKKIPRYYSSLILFIMCLSFCTIITINPVSILHPINTIISFIQELRSFSGGLNINAIADWDYYFPLDDRFSVILAWLSYPYENAFIGIPLTILFISCAFFIKSNLLNKYIIIFLFSQQIIMMLFLCIVSSRVSSFYLLPTLVPLIIYSAYLFFYNIEQKKINKYKKYIIISVILLNTVYISKNITNIVKFIEMSFMRRLGEYNTNALAISNMMNYIKELDIPKGSIMFDLEQPVPFNTNEFNYKTSNVIGAGKIEDFSRALPVTNLWKINAAGNFSDEPYSLAIASSQDLYFVSKLKGNYKYVNTLLKTYKMFKIYENEITIVLSRNRPPVLMSTNIESNIEWYDTHKLNFFELSNEWNGIRGKFKNSLDLRDIVSVEIKFDITGKLEKEDTDLYVGFFGPKIKINNETSNVWHFKINNLSLGRNSTIILKEQFYVSTGKATWGNVMDFFIGGLGNHSSILLKEVKFNVKTPEVQNKEFTILVN